MKEVRPWGSYEVLDEGPRWKVKILSVGPGQRTSLQRHMHRNETWVVVQGTADISIDPTVFLDTVPMYEGEWIAVTRGQWHRLANPGKLPLVIIEVQNGEYLGEDDIERKEDDYGRITES